MKASDIKDFARGLRPILSDEIDSAEILKGMAKAARDKGVDWSQLKKLVKAQIQDEREGVTTRVDAIVEKADFAAAYADMLGIMNKSSATCSSSPPETQQPPKAADKPAGAIDAPLAAQVSPAEIAAPAPAEIPDMPDFLRRSA